MYYTYLVELDYVDGILIGILGLLIIIAIGAGFYVVKMMKRTEETTLMSMEDMKAKKENDYYGNEDYTYYDSIKPITIYSP